MDYSYHILSAAIFEHLWRTMFMVVLLTCSAFFSGSETAFFNLPRRQIRKLSHSAVRTERLIALILSDANRLLTALLFGNMAVNILFCAASSMFSLQIGKSSGAAYGTFFALLSFLALLLCGEMLPKSLAYSNSKRFCRVAAPACYLLIRVLGPVLKTLDFLVVRPSIRLFIRPHASTEVSVNQLRILLESSRRQGLISNDENQLLTEILKFSFLKARHVMQPRVEMPACSIDAPLEQIQQEMIQKGLVKIPVYTQSLDAIVGIIYLRDIFLNPDRPAASLVKKVQFVPEQKSVESLIDFFKQTRTDIAVVVDEYGGIAGWIQFEDIIEQLLGPLEDVADRDPIEQIGPLTYRILAGLPIHDWGEAFGIDIEEQRLTTIAGFVMTLLGKIPKEGETVLFKNMKFTIEKVENNRIQSIVLSLEPVVKNDFSADK